MNDNMLLSKTCSIYASDLHFATVIFPFINKEIRKGTTIKTIFERDELENIEKIIKNIGLNSDIKRKIREDVDWKHTNINKIRENFKLLEQDIERKRNIDIIVLGSNFFIEKVNKVIDLWFKNNIEKIEIKKVKINIVNCFSIEENNQIDSIIESHEYILKTEGIEQIPEEKLLKAN